MSNLTDEQAGKLIKAIGLFGLGEEPKLTDPLVLGIFLGIKHYFKVQSENYHKKVKTNQENGKLGGRPKNPQNPSGYLETHNNPQNLKDKDKDKDKDIEKVYSTSTTVTTKSAKLMEDFENIFGN